MSDDTGRHYSPEEVAKLIALARRALKRIAVLEERMTLLERRQHDLDDLAETVQAMDKLVTNRVGLNEHEVRAIVNATMDKRLTKKGKAIGRDLGGGFE